MSRQSDYITIARQEKKKLWDAVNALKALQLEYNALDYGSTLPDGVGENEGYTKSEVGAVVFATTDAILSLFSAGHATNLAKLL